MYATKRGTTKYDIAGLIFGGDLFTKNAIIMLVKQKQNILK